MSVRKPAGEGYQCQCGDHWFANVGHGYNVIVSPEDAAQFRYKWRARMDRRGYVSVTRSKTVSPGCQVTVTLSREILEAPAGAIVDHANRDTLDNRRANIRLCNQSQNSANAKPRAACGLKGVVARGSRFVAYIRVGGRPTFLGSFASAVDAHAAYVEAARVVHGEFARAA